MSSGIAGEYVPSSATQWSDHERGSRTLWSRISGGNRLLAFQPQLEKLATKCGQAGALDYLAYHLSVPYYGSKQPERLLKSTRLPSPYLNKRSKTPMLLLRHGPAGPVAAVLLSEYYAFGLPTGVFVPIDADGYRTVIAPPDLRATVAREAAEYLLAHRAGIVLLSLCEPEALSVRPSQTPSSLPMHADSPYLAGTQVRENTCILPLAETYDNTLATMGAHTRRNLRAMSRRVAHEFGAVYVAEAQLTEGEFLHLNRMGSYTTPDWVARWRYNTARTVPGGILTGLRAADGRWLSVIGGRRHRGRAYVDWQLNLKNVGSLSLVTAMRSAFLAAEIDEGTRFVRFEGGTPHSMNSAFLVERVHDLLYTRRFLPGSLLRRFAPLVPSGGLLGEVLASPSMVWHNR